MSNPKAAAWQPPTVDPDNPPYARLRQLLRAAFDAPGLRRIAEEAAFADLRYRLPPGADLDAVIDRVLEFCRVELLWGELLTFIAGRQPRIYNHYAAQWGWPPAPEPEAAPPPPPAPSTDPQRAGLEEALKMARRTLAILEKQAAAYTTLTIPAPLQIELEEQRRKVADLEARLR